MNKKSINVFTIAFGDEIYYRMAEKLKDSFEAYHPGLHLKIVDDQQIRFSARNAGIDIHDTMHPKIFKPLGVYLQSMNEDVNLYIDADSFVNANFEEWMAATREILAHGGLCIEYKLNKTGLWDDKPELNFVDECEEAGVKNILPYSLNSGFFMFKDRSNVFRRWFELVSTLQFKSKKGRQGDEYYLCVAIQQSDEAVVRLDLQPLLPVAKLWGGHVKVEEGKLVSSRQSYHPYPVAHYGNHNVMLLPILNHLFSDKSGLLRFLMKNGPRLRKLVRATLRNQMARFRYYGA